MRGLYWLASYPKSGNTWLRVFLSNLRRNPEAPVDINQLDRDGMFASRELLEEILPHTTSELTHDELDRLRREAFDWLGRQPGEPLVLKVHDAFTRLADGEPLIPLPVTRGAVYVARNPLDVAASFADHLGVSVDVAIRRMAAPRFRMAGRPGALDHQARQLLLSWSGHVRSWLDEARFPVLLVRYEDLEQRPLETFAGLAAFLGLPDEPDRVSRAARFSEFGELRRQEEANGFNERSPASERFFRRGVAGGWRESLSREQALAVVAAHSDVMCRLGYQAEVEEVVAAGRRVAT